MEPKSYGSIPGLALLVGFLCTGSASGQDLWDGGGSDDSWSTAQNWSGDVAPANDGSATVMFAGTTRLAPSVDMPWNITGLAFNAGSGSFVISGSSITTGSGGIIQSATATQTINNSVILAAAQTWRANTGNLTFGGSVDNAGFLLNLEAAMARSISLNGLVSGFGGLQKTGIGTLTISGNNSYAGGTTLSAGTLVANHDNALGSGVLALNGGTLNTAGARNFSNSVNIGGNIALSGQPMTFSGSFTLAANATLNITNTTTLSTGLLQSGGARALTKSGRGSLIILNTLASTGNVTASGGVLALGSGVSLPGSLLTLSGGQLATQGTFSRTLGTGAGDVRFTKGGFSAFGGPLTITGFTGTPEWGSTANFLGSNSTLIFGSTLANDVVTWTNDFSLGAQNRTISVTDNSSTTADRAVISGVISGAGGVVKTGSGRLDLNANNSFGGEMAIRQGEVAVDTLANTGAASALGSGAAIRLGNATSAGTLRYTGIGHSTNRPIFLAGSTGGGTLIADGSGTVDFSGALSASAAGAKTLTLSGTGTGQFSGAISNGSGTVAVSKTGANLWILTGTNSHTGDTRISAGILEAGNGSVFGGGLVVMAGGTLRASAPAAFANNFSQTGNFTISGSTAITVNGNFAQTGSRTLTVSNSALTTFSGSTFTLAENNQPRTLTLAGTGNVLISSVIRDGTGTGADGLRKTSTSELTLNGNNTYSGVTTLTAGLLSLGHNSALGTGGFTVTGGTLRAVGGSRSLANAVTLGGNLTFSGTDHLVFSGATTLTGNRTVTNSASGTLTLSNINLSNSTTSRTLTLAGAGEIVISGVIANGGGSTAGRITKTGAGRLILQGHSTYTGITTVSAGTLLVNGSLANTLTTVGAAATVGGDGAFNSGLTIHGELSVGASTAITSIGSLDLNAGASLTSSGVYRPGILGVNPALVDRINVTGVFSANGTIAPVLSGYSPVAGDAFDIADFTSFSGTPTFDYSSAVLGAGLTWNSSFFGIDGTLRVIPEPGASLMFFLSLAGLLLSRRR
jgi:autotransporter-associated beta strand protein